MTDPWAVPRTWRRNGTRAAASAGPKPAACRNVARDPLLRRTVTRVQGAQGRRRPAAPGRSRRRRAAPRAPARATSPAGPGRSAPTAPAGSRAPARGSAAAEASRPAAPATPLTVSARGRRRPRPVSSRRARWFSSSPASWLRWDSTARLAQPCGVRRSAGHVEPVMGHEREADRDDLVGGGPGRQDRPLADRLHEVAAPLRSATGGDLQHRQQPLTTDPPVPGLAGEVARPRRVPGPGETDGEQHDDGARVAVASSGDGVLGQPASGRPVPTPGRDRPVVVQVRQQPGETPVVTPRHEGFQVRRHEPNLRDGLSCRGGSRPRRSADRPAPRNRPGVRPPPAGRPGSRWPPRRRRAGARPRPAAGRPHP